MTELEKVLSTMNGESEEVVHYTQTRKDFEELLMMYAGAIREVRTKLEVLNDEFQIKSRRNPIRYINSRIKKPSSILEKLYRRNYPVTLESLKENMHDIAGIRVICAYGSDIYAIAEMLMKQDDVMVLMVKDYIQNPKPNGYRSLHLVIEIPVFFSDRKQFMKVEVQIRTMAMDFWASLEHQLRYKTEGKPSEEISNELRDCAEIIHETDARMESIYKKMQTIKSSKQIDCVEKY